MVVVLRLHAVIKRWRLEILPKPVLRHFLVEGIESPDVLFSDFFEPFSSFIVLDPDRRWGDGDDPGLAGVGWCRFAVFGESKDCFSHLPHQFVVRRL